MNHNQGKVDFRVRNLSIDRKFDNKVASFTGICLGQLVPIMELPRHLPHLKGKTTWRLINLFMPNTSILQDLFFQLSSENETSNDGGNETIM